MNFIISDLRINEEKAANDAGLSLEDYNKMIVEKWNSVVKNDNDIVFVYGKFGGGFRETLKETIDKMNGLIYIMNSKENEFNPVFWESMGIYKIWDCGFRYKKEDLSFSTSGSKEYDYQIVSGKANLGVPFKDKKLSLEAKYWDYTPIDVEELPQIVLRMSEFDKMEEG